jgi:asparagine synthase (glutamine-hydrolysing)
MCGIAGFVQRESAPGILEAMLARIAHRGPDGDGRWIGERDGWVVHLGHRRLSIIDIEGGRQPMGNEDGSVQLTYNGELYNFRELRKRLEPGHRFTTRSDTEVIVHHVEDTGQKGLAELDGMFAFAAWDGRSGELLLARDRPGIKPLYYASLPDGGVVFASELSALLVHPGVARRLSREGVLSYFFCDYALPPCSLVDGVKKLEPACSASWKNGVLSRSEPYWSMEAAVSAHPAADRAAKRWGSDDDLAAELWRRLDQAVEHQMIADVPVGVFLSGGVDSSSVASLARAHTRERLRTFSIGFSSKTFDESGYARRVAEHIGSDHTEEIISDSTLLDVLDAVLDALDEPLADHSFLPTWLLSRMTAKHVKVVLGGDGGDELWGGYPTYRAHRYARLYSRLPARFKNETVHRMLERLPVSAGYQGFDWKLRRFSGRWDDDPRVRHFRWLSSIDLPDLARALPFSAGVTPYPLSVSFPAMGDLLADLLAIDFSSYMHASVLTKVDRASMAHSLEVRPPILDTAFVEWSSSVPSRYKLRHGVTKYLFKRAARAHLPHDIVDRPKRGFGIPLIAWLRGPLLPNLDEALGDSVLWEDGLLDRATFRAWRDDHAAGRADASKPLWALLVLSRWARRERITGS